jgi:hypothetical protein
MAAEWARALVCIFTDARIESRLPGIRDVLPVPEADHPTSLPGRVFPLGFGGEPVAFDPGNVGRDMPIGIEELARLDIVCRRKPLHPAQPIGVRGRVVPRKAYRRMLIGLREPGVRPVETLVKVESMMIRIPPTTATEFQRFLVERVSLFVR